MYTKAVIFDFDDTLMMTQQTKYAAHKYVAKKFYGMEISDALIDQYWGLGQEEFLRGLYGEVEPVSQIFEKYVSVSETMFPNKAYPGALELLQGLYDRYPLGLVSSASRILVEMNMETVGMPVDWFVMVQGSEDTNTHKPDPAVFEPILGRLRQLELEAGDCVYVGDSWRDYEAARDAGMGFVGIHDRTTSREKFAELGADSVGTYEELKKKLLGELY